jgi:hypothetical protein
MWAGLPTGPQETGAIAADACTEPSIVSHRASSRYIDPKADTLKNQEDDELRNLIESYAKGARKPDGETVRLLPGNWCPARGPSRAFANAAVAC